MSITVVENADQIAKCFEMVHQLRPHLKNKAEFVIQVQYQQLHEGYKLAAIMLDSGEIAACMGYRPVTKLETGRALHIDDLITAEKHRRKGYGSVLLEWAREYAQAKGMKSVILDCGYSRVDAHRLSLNHGYRLCGHRFRLDLPSNGQTQLVPPTTPKR